jgi:hypothetical protein
MNRRDFLSRVSTGLVGAAVLTKVPVKWLPAPVQRFAALEYLRTAFNNDCERRQKERLAYPNVPCDTYPRGVVVSPWLFEQAELEMRAKAMGMGDYWIFCNADVPMPNLMFKGATLVLDATCPLRTVYLFDDDGFRRYLAFQQVTRAV